MPMALPWPSHKLKGATSWRTLGRSSARFITASWADYRNASSVDQCIPIDSRHGGGAHSVAPSQVQSMSRGRVGPGSAPTGMTCSSAALAPRAAARAPRCRLHTRDCLCLPAARSTCAALLWLQLAPYHHHHPRPISQQLHAARRRPLSVCLGFPSATNSAAASVLAAPSQHISPTPAAARSMLAACPPLVYGTAWKEGATSGLVLQALAAGFRAIDTAAQRKHYREHAVGEALLAAERARIVRRDDVWVQTKCVAAPQVYRPAVVSLTLTAPGTRPSLARTAHSRCRTALRRPCASRCVPAPSPRCAPCTTARAGTLAVWPAVKRRRHRLL